MSIPRVMREVLFVDHTMDFKDVSGNGTKWVGVPSVRCELSCGHIEHRRRKTAPGSLNCSTCQHDAWLASLVYALKNRISK